MSEKVTVTVRIPEQFYDFTYDKDLWDSAVKNDDIDNLMDWDISDIDIVDEVYGPDGHQLQLWN